MLQLDPWSKAIECDRAIERVADPERRIVLEGLRRVWVALSHERSFLNAPERAGQLSTIAQIHRELMVDYRTAMH